MPKIVRGSIVAVLVAMLLGLTSSAIPAYALTLPFTDHFSNVSAWGTVPYTIGGVTAPAPSVDTSQNAPGSTGGALRFTFPAGWPPGYEPGKAWGGFPETDELWTEYWFKYSDGFEFHQVGTKQVYWVLSGGGNRDGDFMLIVSGSTATTKKLRMTTQPKGGTFTNYDPNLGYNPTIETGVWYKMTIHIKLNTTTSPFNGIFRVWLNDTPLMDYKNVNYRTNTYINSKLVTLELVPVWGGAGGPNKTKTDYFWLDALRIQAAPIIGGGGTTPSLVPMAPSNIVIN